MMTMTSSLPIRKDIMNKRWTVAAVVVNAFIFIAQYVAGQNPTTIDCLDIATEGQKTEIKCTIGALQKGVSWTRPDGKEVVFCEYRSKNCTTTEQYEGQYVGVRDSWTEVRLLIESFDSDTDAGEWACRDGFLGQDSDTSKCNKTDKINPATSIDCMDAGNTGYPTELKCKILRYLTMGIFWVRPDSAVVVKCSINNTRCTSTEGPPGQYTGVAHSSTANTLKIKSFNPETEAGTWICRDGDHGAKSSCVKTHSIVIKTTQNTTPTTVPTFSSTRTSTTPSTVRTTTAVVPTTTKSTSRTYTTGTTPTTSTEPGHPEHMSGEKNWFLMVGVPIILLLIFCAPVAWIIYHMSGAIFRRYKQKGEQKYLTSSHYDYQNEDKRGYKGEYTSDYYTNDYDYINETKSGPKSERKESKVK